MQRAVINYTTGGSYLHELIPSQHPVATFSFLQLKFSAVSVYTHDVTHVRFLWNVSHLFKSTWEINVADFDRFIYTALGV